MFLELAGSLFYQGVQSGDVFLLLLDLRLHIVDLILGELLQHTFLQGTLVHTVQALGVEDVVGNDLAVLLAENQIALAVKELLNCVNAHVGSQGAVCQSGAAAAYYVSQAGEFGFHLSLCFDALRNMKQQAQNQPSKGTSSGTVAGAGPGQPGNAQNPNAGSQAAQQELDNQLPKAPPNFTVKTSAVPSTQSFTPDKNQTQAMRLQLERVLAEETARIAAHLTSSVESTGNGGVDHNSEYEGYGYEHAAADIERILESMAEAQVNEAMEEELSEDLQREADTISYGNAHRNIHVTVNRMARVDQELIDGYNSVAPDLLMLSRRLQRSVGAVLRDKRQGGKQTGLLVGKRLNQHAFHRNDGRIFCNTRLPTEPINLAVGLLIDESGSMGGGDRITRARATAIVVHDFCEKLGIPIMITGHTARSAHVDLFSYADFDSVDRNDRYRLMDLSARCCNRDGAALRFAAEKLCRYPSEVKMLIIICDGQPNDSGYSGTAAEADLRGIKLEYSRKGVQIFAAAIGDDREKIERIYGSGFLDITDLNELPVMLTQLISRNLPQ